MNKDYRINKIFFLTILIAAVFALAGCAPSAATPATGQTPAAGDTTPVIPQTGGNQVEVRLDDGVINMPATIPAGETSFVVMNAGTGEHSFRIEGQGIEAELARHLQPGDTLTLEVDLAAGEYEVFCPVEDHATLGMRTELTVVEP